MILWPVLSYSQLSFPEDTDYYYYKYNDRLIVSVFQSYRYYNMTIEQKQMKDSLGRSKLSYEAESNNITGVELNYDKLNVSFGFKSAPASNQAAKGSTHYSNLVFNVGGNEWILENSYRYYKGFYDNNTRNYDTALSNKGIYTHQPGIVSQSYRTKFMYFTNHRKFSFKSGYSCAYRQTHTAASFIFMGNIYYNRLNSDSSLIPYQVRSYYGNYGDIHGLNVLAFSACAGGSINIVIWRALFLNLTAVVGPEEQWRTYSYLGNNETRTLNYMSFTADLRASFGLNFKKWFFLISSGNDISWYGSTQLGVMSKYASVNVAIGYRFHMKTPKPYRKFQQTRLYRAL